GGVCAPAAAPPSQVATSPTRSSLRVRPALRVSGLLMLGTSRESSPLPEDEGILGSRQHKPPRGRRTSQRIPDRFRTFLQTGCRRARDTCHLSHDADPGPMVTPPTGQPPGVRRLLAPWPSMGGGREIARRSGWSSWP